jgi:hypothetical protein
MSARVFISCGQRKGEREVAGAVARWFAERGFRPCVALEAQSIQDVNSGIIGELRRADYYVFIDFRREPLSDADPQEYRGSLFSHQELAVAHAMGFEHCLFFRESGVKLEGMCQFMASNATPFDTRSEVPGLVAAAAEQRAWTPDYSRNLVVARLHYPDQRIQFGELRGRALHADIENRRPDVGAAGAVARLAMMRTAGDGWRISPDRSHLKVTGQPGFEQTIWPKSHGAFCLLFVDMRNERCCVYLINALDIAPRPLLLDDPGDHLLRYEVFAQGFDVLCFKVQIRIPTRGTEFSAELVDNGDDVA